MFNLKAKKTTKAKQENIAISPSPEIPEEDKNINQIDPRSGERLSDLKEDVHFILVVLFVGFLALVVTVIFGAGGWYVTYMAQKQATFEDLKDQVLIQSSKIDNLTGEIIKLNAQIEPKK
jgi:hypothetical protein